MYSVGDRVEVRWKTKPCRATVIHVHSAEIVNVVYDIDSSVGVFLTAKEHGLKLVGDEERGGGSKKVCVVDGCPNLANFKGQLCKKHDGPPSRGLCTKHGARGEHLREGCANPARTMAGTSASAAAVNSGNAGALKEAKDLALLKADDGTWSFTFHSVLWHPF